METLGYFIVIFISLCLLSIFIIIIEYYRPIFLDWLLKKEYRLFSFLFLSLFGVSSYSTYLLIKPSIDIPYFIFYVFVITFSTVVCFFIFFKIRKGTRTRENLAINNMELDETAVLNQEDLNLNDEEFVKKSKDESISKNQKKTNVINYNSFFTSNQLSYLWTNLRIHEIIDDNYSEDDFCKNFINKEIMINMDARSLYYFHEEISKLIDEEIELKYFVPFFRNRKNKKFIYGSVRNGVSTPNHKLIEKFKGIFNNFPK